MSAAVSFAIGREKESCRMSANESPRPECSVDSTFFLNLREVNAQSSTGVFSCRHDA